MAVGPNGIMYLPKPGQRAVGNIGGQLSSPYAQQIQQLAAQLGGGGGNAQNFNVPAPNLAPGTYQGAYAAQGLRTSNPAQAAQLWEHRHPGQMHQGNIPGWVTDALTQELQGAPGQGGNHMNPHAVLEQVVNHHRQANGLPQMHPEDLHGRVTSLAHEILNGRNNRLQQALRGIRPPAPPVQAPAGPVGGPFQAS